MDLDLVGRAAKSLLARGHLSSPTPCASGQWMVKLPSLLHAGIRTRTSNGSTILGAGYWEKQEAGVIIRAYCYLKTRPGSGLGKGG